MELTRSTSGIGDGMYLGVDFGGGGFWERESW